MGEIRNPIKKTKLETNSISKILHSKFKKDGNNMQINIRKDEASQRREYFNNNFCFFITYNINKIKQKTLKTKKILKLIGIYFHSLFEKLDIIIDKLTLII